MDYQITAEERAGFKRCRRQWDFASRHRRDLEPVDCDATDFAPALRTALLEALAVYYYPGMWDWPDQMTQSLVLKALDRSLDEAGAMGESAKGAALLDCYHAWATTVDDFAPVKINQEVYALVPDPGSRDYGLKAGLTAGLTTPDGSGVQYVAHVDLLAVDAADEYWVVRHQIVDDWQDLDALIRDEAAVAACWTWEQDFIGMDIAGTIHNEVRVTGRLEFPSPDVRAADKMKAVAQSEASGGGRSIPQHMRVSAVAARSEDAKRTEQTTAGVLRRTRIRRTREEITAVAELVAAEAIDMTRAPAIYPSPAAHCQTCEFNAPCLAMTEGADAERLLATGFRRRAVTGRPKPKLGQNTWGFGRGAAPPDW